MIAANYTDLRGNMKSYFDRVTDECETLVVTRKGENSNVVVISEERYNNMLENMHLLGDPANREWLRESIAQLESGQARERELITCE